MTNTPQAAKRVRQAERRAAANRPFRTRATRAVRDARVAIAESADNAEVLVRDAQSALDRAARRNIIHANAAARTKSRLASGLKAARAK